MKPQAVARAGWSRRQVLAGAAITLATPLKDAMAAPAMLPAPIDWSALRLLDEHGDGPARWVGLPVVVVFWATWCPFCKRHNAHIEKLYQFSRGKAFRVLGVSSENDREKIRNHVLANQIHFPIAMAQPGFRAQFTSRNVIPLTCLVGADGRLMQTMAGEMQEDDVMSLAVTLGAAKPRIEAVSLLTRDLIWAS
ncbi:TlpA disulfide reductase family protein [Rhodoferax sp. PAMC 29310]|uniref:TlpA disulfide reductase family protein n=1 Tax=Rhodoferax sp. PAMC 29310 TaxID=2822760 RepID=UPI001B33261D|nr:TlpA disulfide reductase family protein [Rhodoferax sp. PAMC 29310]